MRLLLLCGLLLTACSTDTFTGDDGGGGGGDSASDGTSPGDAISGGDGTTLDVAPAFDPSMLGPSVVLWMDANDAKIGDAGNIVASWPDHQKRYTTSTNLGGSTATCTIP